MRPTSGRAINARRLSARQMPHDIGAMHSRLPRKAAASGAAPLAQYDPHEIGGILGAELFHDAGAVHLDGAR